MMDQWYFTESLFGERNTSMGGNSKIVPGLPRPIHKDF